MWWKISLYLFLVDVIGWANIPSSKHLELCTYCATFFLLSVLLRSVWCLFFWSGNLDFSFSSRSFEVFPLIHFIKFHHKVSVGIIFLILFGTRGALVHVFCSGKVFLLVYFVFSFHLLFIQEFSLDGDIYLWLHPLSASLRISMYPCLLLLALWENLFSHYFAIWLFLLLLNFFLSAIDL
jgi:hypothetical protein